MHYYCSDAVRGQSTPHRADECVGGEGYASIEKAVVCVGAMKAVSSWCMIHIKCYLGRAALHAMAPSRTADSSSLGHGGSNRCSRHLSQLSAGAARHATHLLPSPPFDIVVADTAAASASGIRCNRTLVCHHELVCDRLAAATAHQLCRADTVTSSIFSPASHSTLPSNLRPFFLVQPLSR